VYRDSLYTYRVREVLTPVFQSWLSPLRNGIGWWIWPANPLISSVYSWWEKSVLKPTIMILEALKGTVVEIICYYYYYSNCLFGFSHLRYHTLFTLGYGIGFSIICAQRAN
jgi:hypothetical protein